MRTPFSSARPPESRLERWAYALKPASWPKLFVPALFWQALGASETGALGLEALVWGVAFTLFGLGFIVLLNDWGDREVDAIKRSMFPDGCSPKTIPDGVIDARSIAIAGFFFGAATLLVAAGAERSLSRRFAFEAGSGCMLLFVAYTLPPIRLNYRGGGELLEMAGVGLALPALQRLSTGRVRSAGSMALDLGVLRHESGEWGRERALGRGKRPRRRQAYVRVDAWQCRGADAHGSPARARRRHLAGRLDRSAESGTALRFCERRAHCLMELRRDAARQQACSHQRRFENRPSTSASFIVRSGIVQP